MSAEEDLDSREALKSCLDLYKAAADKLRRAQWRLDVVEWRLDQVAGRLGDQESFKEKCAARLARLRARIDYTESPSSRLRRHFKLEVQEANRALFLLAGEMRPYIIRLSRDLTEATQSLGMFERFVGGSDAAMVSALVEKLIDVQKVNRSDAEAMPRATSSTVRRRGRLLRD